MSQKHVWDGIATLVGVIIGAGILGIPYVVQQAGFWTGMLVIVTIGLAMLLINLMLGEVTLRTKGHHQLTGYTNVYLGTWGKHLMALSMIVGIYGALIAYTVGEGQALAQLFGGSAWLWSSAFFVVMAILMYAGLRTIEASEFVLNIVKLGLFVLILGLLVSSRFFSLQNIAGFSWQHLLVPYGVVLFAFLGTSAIPEVREELRGHWKQLKKAIIIGSLIPLIVYVLFSFGVVATTAGGTTELATVGLGLLGSWTLLVMNLFATLAMGTAFLGLGLALKEMYVYDYGWKPGFAWLITMAVPLAALAFGVQSFIGVIELTGAVTGGIAGVLIVLMHYRAQKNGQRKPEYTVHVPVLLGLLLALMFIVGAVHALLA